VASPRALLPSVGWHDAAQRRVEPAALPRDESAKTAVASKQRFFVFVRTEAASHDTPRDRSRAGHVQEGGADRAPGGDLFYGRLFEIAPDVRALFPADLAEQKKKLIAMLATAVNNLHQVGSIVPAVQDLGRRHVGYGVTAARITNQVARALP